MAQAVGIKEPPARMIYSRLMKRIAESLNHHEDSNASSEDNKVATEKDNGTETDLKEGTIEEK